MPTKSQFFGENICSRMEPHKNEGGGVMETWLWSVNEKRLYEGRKMEAI